MKIKFTFLALLVTGLMMAQGSADEDAVKNAIDTFFKGFHQQDSTLMYQILSKEAVVQTIAKDKSGKSVVKTEAVSEVVNGILGIPKDKSFEEKLLAYEIQIDGPLAHAWTPYEFWFDGKFSHCGVDSFELFKDDGEWKIIYLIDTRRSYDCMLEEE